MHQHIGDARVGDPYRVLHLVCDPMAITHRQVAVDDDMEIDIIIEAHFPDKTFLNVDYAWYRDCDGLDLVEKAGSGEGVPKLGNGGAQQQECVHSDHT